MPNTKNEQGKALMIEKKAWNDRTKALISTKVQFVVKNIAHNMSKTFKQKGLSKSKIFQTFKLDAQGFRKKHVIKSSHIKKFFGVHNGDSKLALLEH